MGDGYVPIGLADAVVPFRSPYRPFWVGLGAVALDLLLAVLVTSALRHRIGYGSWRFVHWLAYLCWPVAVLHGLGTGSDASLGPVLAIDALCTAAVLAVVAWRLATGRSFGTRRRLIGAAVAVVATVVIAGVAALGPLRPGWSHRSGTSSALLAQIAARHTAAGSSAAGSSAAGSSAAGSSAVPPPTTAPVTAGGGTGEPAGSVPTAPFSYPVTGSRSTTPTASGDVRIALDLQLGDPTSTRLTIDLDGVAAPGGGVALQTGAVEFGPYPGTVISLDGDTVVATVPGAGPLTLTVTLRVDQRSGALTGTATGAGR